MMHVSIKGFKISDCDTGSSVVDASIYRISYVTVSQTHKHVYAFVYQNPQTKLIECHAFDCRTKNYAKRILRASFIAFNLAFDRYYKETDNIQRAILLKETKAFNLNELKDFQNENNNNNLEVNLTQDSKNKMLNDSSKKITMSTKKLRDNSLNISKWSSFSPRTNKIYDENRKCTYINSFSKERNFNL